jgi:hypothetical protein
MLSIHYKIWKKRCEEDPVMCALPERVRPPRARAPSPSACALPGRIEIKKGGSCGSTPLWALMRVFRALPWFTPCCQQHQTAAAKSMGYSVMPSFLGFLAASSWAFSRSARDLCATKSAWRMSSALASSSASNLAFSLQSRFWYSIASK